jgi:hypothetical protein
MARAYRPINYRAICADEADPDLPNLQPKGVKVPQAKNSHVSICFSHEMVEAAGIENVFTLTKSGTYSRNKCLKSASRTFASTLNTVRRPCRPGPPRRTDIQTKLACGTEHIRLVIMLVS